MRVIAGVCRGMKMSAPPGNSTRPTSDRVKEALFNIISSRFSLDGAAVLDICAGTGALGIEALSRGAAFCSFIESDRKALSFLEKNILDPRIKSRSGIMNMDVMRALPLLAGRGKKYNVVFFDPPYNSGLYAEVPEGLCSLNLLAPDANFIAECSVRNELPNTLRQLVKYERRIYGETALEFFSMEGT